MQTLGFIIVVVGLIVAIMVDKKRKLDVNEKIVELRIRLETCQSMEEAHEIYFEVKGLFKTDMNRATQFMVRDLLDDTKAVIMQLKMI